LRVVKEPHRAVTRLPNAVEPALPLPRRPEFGPVRTPLPGELAGAFEQEPALSRGIRFLVAKDETFALDLSFQCGIRSVPARDMATFLGQVHGAIGRD